MREIKTHQINECNSGLKLHAEEQLGPGGAPHRYEISFGRAPRPENLRTVVTLDFQNGAIKEVGTNGITHEVLLAVLIDRLEHFQSGPYACSENTTALLALKEAQAALHSRTKRRVEAGTEGTMKLDGFDVVGVDLSAAPSPITEVALFPPSQAAVSDEMRGMGRSEEKEI